MPLPRAGSLARAEKGHRQPRDEAECGTNVSGQRHMRDAGTDSQTGRLFQQQEARGSFLQELGRRAAAMGGLPGDTMLLPSSGDWNVPPDCSTKEWKLKQAAGPFCLLN